MRTSPISHADAARPGRQGPTRARPVLLADVLPRLPRLRCGACRGRVVLEPPGLYERAYLSCRDCRREFNEVVARLPRQFVPLAYDETHRRPGRPPKAPPPPGDPARWHRPPTPCADCGEPAAGTRCRPCSAANVATKWPRLIDLLADGLPMRVADIMAALGISDASLRQFVHKARCAGYLIETNRLHGTYQIVRQP